MNDSGNILTQAEFKVVLRELFKRSQSDWEFRELCLRNPAAAIRQISGKCLPEGVTLQLRDASEPTLT